LASLVLLALIGSSIPPSRPAHAQQSTAILFQNVRIFDGKSNALSAPSHVLVRDNKIEKISTVAFPADAARTMTLDGAGRVLEVIGTDAAYALAKKYKIKTAFGTDILFSEKLAQRQGAQLAKLTRWYTPVEVLTMATNAELLGLSGLRNPYPGRLGVVEEGALADLLLIDGDPLADIALIANPEKNFRVIMKDGKIHKNTL
jgi:imidazolonepropionase-like amidohydrolase